jgi:phenylalanyl-tRNA synthetase beta chain
MLEMGQPLHAFDFRLLTARPGELPSIVVKCAAAGQEFVTLDGKKHSLNEQILLINDETKALALAGVMGGQNSEIGPDTVDVLIESACFKPQNIRATSKKLDLRTDSSYRYERGADVGISARAGRRAAQLILETAGGILREQAIDAWPEPAPLRKVPLRFARCDQLLGVAVPPVDQVRFLEHLEFKPVEQDGARAVFEVPSFRVDIKREADLIEEIARLYGVDKIPATPPRGALGINSFDTVHDDLALARRLLTGLGLTEIQGQTLISEVSAKLTAGAAEVATLRYPLSSDMNALRPSLLAGLLDVLRCNISRKNNDVAIFEIGRVFAQPGGKTATEQRRLAVAMTGARRPLHWDGADRDARCNIFDLKGALEEFLDQFGVRGVTWSRREGSSALYLESAAIGLGRLPLGEIGQLSPALAKQYDLRDAVLLAELNFDDLLARRVSAKSFKALPQFPTIRRDVAMLVPEATTHEAVTNVVKQTKPANLEKVELFDIFRGKNVAEGRKSMAYAFTYRHPDRTLTDAEVNSAHEKLVEQFKQTLHATIRES